MNFVHADRDFSDLLAQVASLRGLSTGLIEKDYWVTHALWGLHLQGFDVWFKGGTSLSKGFGLIQRFSEDLDSCEASGFVRHFEDSARIIQAEEELPPLGEGYPDVRILAQEMLAQKQIRELAGPADEAFALADGERTDSIRGAFRAIGGLYWGPRMTLDDACRSIRDWLGERFPQAGGT